MVSTIREVFGNAVQQHAIGGRGGIIVQAVYIEGDLGIHGSR